MSEPLLPLGRTIGHSEAKQAAQRLINSHFGNADGARVSIPADPDRDDDLVIMSYIAQQALQEGRAPVMARPEASSIEALWQDLLDKDDRTSPAEYPDMALITFDEFKNAIKSAGPEGRAPVTQASSDLVARLRSLVADKGDRPPTMHERRSEEWIENLCRAAIQAADVLEARVPVTDKMVEAAFYESCAEPTWADIRRMIEAALAAREP